MKVHRITAGLAALLVIFTLLSGCALIEQDKEEEIPKKQLYVYYPHDNSHIMKSLIMQYNHMQQEVIVEGIEGSGLRTEFLEKLTELNQAGETVPDVILIHDTWLAKLAAEKEIRSLDGGLYKDKGWQFFAGMTDAMVWREQIYGLPFWQDAPLLYYRSDLVEDPPASWDELSHMVVQARKSNEMEYGFIFPGESEENAAAFLGSIWSFFGSYPDFEAEETILDEQAVANTWNCITSMAKNEVISPDFLNMSAENCRTVFEAGNAVFMWNWSYAARLFLDEESPISGKVGVAPLPTSNEEAGGILSGYALTMSSHTGRIPESWEFMEFLVSEQSQSKIKDAGLMPAEASLYRPEWLKKIGLNSSYKHIMQTGHTLKPGRNVDGTLSVMAGAVSLAFEQNKKMEDFILLLKEGIVDEDLVDESDQEGEGSEETEPFDEADSLNESAGGAGDSE